VHEAYPRADPTEQDEHLGEHPRFRRPVYLTKLCSDQREIGLPRVKARGLAKPVFVFCFRRARGHQRIAGFESITAIRPPAVA